MVFYPVWLLNMNKKTDRRDRHQNLFRFGSNYKIFSNKFIVHKCLCIVCVLICFTWKYKVAKNLSVSKISSHGEILSHKLQQMAFDQFKTRVWTHRAVGALADLPLSLCDSVDLALVPVAGPLHHLQARQQRVLLLLQLFHLLQLCELKGGCVVGERRGGTGRVKWWKREAENVVRNKQKKSTWRHFLQRFYIKTPWKENITFSYFARRHWEL